MKNYLISEAIGDIAGSAYEGRTHRIKDYDKVKMFSSRAHFTDDTVLTFACAEAFIDHLDMTMNLWKCANEHRHAGFGSRFKLWMQSHHPQPYRSLGNGSAMRCSSAGWLAQTEEECIRMAHETAAPTHNHPEGFKGAEATAVAIWLARQGWKIPEIRAHVVENYYPMDFTLDEIRPTYHMDESCQGSVPQALEAFFESTSFEDAVRNAVSIGGDSDTIAAIAGSVAEAYWGVPKDLAAKAESYLEPEMVQVLKTFQLRYAGNIIE